MAKPKDQDSVQLGVWIRRDLWTQVNSWRHDMDIDSKKEAVETLLEWAIKNPPPKSK